MSGLEEGAGGAPENILRDILGTALSARCPCTGSSMTEFIACISWSIQGTVWVQCEQQSLYLVSGSCQGLLVDCEQSGWHRSEGVGSNKEKPGGKNKEMAVFPCTLSEEKDEKHWMVCFNLLFLLTSKQPAIIVLDFTIHVADTAALSAGSMPANQECPRSPPFPLTHRCHTEHGLLQ